MRWRPSADALMADAAGLTLIMYYVYVIKSESGNRIYTGYTDNLENRLLQHNKGYSAATKIFNDWKFIYTEQYDNRSLAMKREKYLKSGKGREVLKLKGII